MKWYRRKKVLFTGFVLALSGVAAISWSSYRSTVQLVDADEQIRHAYEVLNRLHQLVGLLRNAQAARRGYVLTEDLSFLNEFHLSAHQIPDVTEELIRLTAANPGKQEKLERLKNLLKQKLDAMEQSLKHFKGIDVDSDAQAQFISEGKKTTDAILFIVDELERKEKSLLELDTAESKARIRNTLTTLLFGTTSSAALLITIFLFLRKEISEREAAQELIRKYAEETSDLYNNAPCGYHSLDRDGTMIHINDTELGWLGYSRDEIIGKKKFTDLITPASLKIFQENFPIFKSRGWIKDIEFEITRKDGSVFPVLLNATALKDAEGNFVMSRSTLFDITERKRVEEALQASEERIRAIIENMFAGLITASWDGIIESVNPAAERIFGYRQEELVGQHLKVLLPGKVADPMDFLSQAAKKALGRITEWQGRRKNGEIFPFELSLFEFETLRSKHFAGNIMDVSQRHEVERLKREFVATVSHELRTPLTSIRGSLSLLAAGALGPLSQETREVVEIAERNTLRLINLINDILDLERLESGKLEMHFGEASVASVIERSVEAVRGFARQSGIEFDIAACSATVEADSDRLVQVLVNLLSNAVKFSPAGTSVQLVAEQADKWLEVKVIDQGRGIPGTHTDLVFQRFHQVESSDARTESGSGLGLAISKGIIEQHDGEIGVVSEVGKGSTFWFRIPVSRASGKIPLPQQGNSLYS